MAKKGRTGPDRLLSAAAMIGFVLAVVAAGGTLLWMLSLTGESATEMRGTRIPIAAPAAPPAAAPRRVRPVVQATPSPQRPPEEAVTEDVSPPASPRPAEAGDLDV